ncbi:hypothetical protein [Bradyrhizobium sp. JYMT SZCCT0180]|nr:hypothetical protein [Bradyrhizobium sp. JYMT SZCCT0180]
MPIPIYLPLDTSDYQRSNICNGWISKGRRFVELEREAAISAEI